MNLAITVSRIAKIKARLKKKIRLFLFTSQRNNCLIRSQLEPQDVYYGETRNLFLALLNTTFTCKALSSTSSQSAKKACANTASTLAKKLLPSHSLITLRLLPFSLTYWAANTLLFPAAKSTVMQPSAIKLTYLDYQVPGNFLSICPRHNFPSSTSMSATRMAIFMIRLRSA